MVRFLAFIGLVLAGCVYVDPINQRPGIAIRQVPLENEDGQIHRGEPSLKLEAVSDDPEDHLVTFHWVINACTGAADCDDQPLIDSLQPAVDLRVPTHRLDGRPVELLAVTLDGRDEYGATSRPVQTLQLPVVDALPDVVIDHQAPYDGIVNTPIDLFALYGDLDDDPDAVTIAWKAFSPSLVEFELTDIVTAPPTDPTKRQVGKRLVPGVTGQWTIEVTATDPVGGQRVVPYTLVVGVDGPPCLQQWSPIAPIGEALLPITEPTLFQVPYVSDALDQYPTILNDPLRGVATFAWSIKPAGVARQVLAGVTANSIAFDPASFTPGDLVEVRVEVFDRHATPVTCDDADQTCALVATNPGCIQRQTWQVEVR
jgi:hypothetical protein